MPGKIQINDLEKFLQAVEDANCLKVYDEVIIKHKRGNIEEVHKIADVFIEGDLSELYNLETEKTDGKYKYFHFRRKR